MESERQLSFKRVIKLLALAILLPVVVIIVVGQVLSSIGWCTGFFPDSASNCSNTPFLNEIFTTIHHKYVSIFVIGFILILPAAFVAIPSFIIIKIIRWAKSSKG